MTEALVKGFALGLVLAMSVGPVIFTVIKQSLNNGKEGGFSFVAGVWISDLFLVFLSNVFSEWVSELLDFKKAIGYGGSVFLIGLGLFYIFFKKVLVKQSSGGDQPGLSKHDYIKIALSGLLINTLNPSVILFWLINATAFSLTHTLQQRIVIFSSCMLLNIFADSAKVLLAGKLRSRLTLHNISIINKISGTILVGFGLVLLYGVMFLSNKKPEIKEANIVLYRSNDYQRGDTIKVRGTDSLNYIGQLIHNKKAATSHFTKTYHLELVYYDGRVKEFSGDGKFISDKKGMYELPSGDQLEEFLEIVK